MVDGGGAIGRKRYDKEVSKEKPATLLSVKITAIQK